jgi:hypothetical protein
MPTIAQATVGFFTQWDPPWALLLGQVGFFDQFTVTMNRLSQALAMEAANEFDGRFGIQMGQAKDNRALLAAVGPQPSSVAALDIRVSWSGCRPSRSQAIDDPCPEEPTRNVLTCELWR